MFIIISAELHKLYSPYTSTGAINEGRRDGHEVKHMGDSENIPVWKRLVAGLYIDGRILQQQGMRM
jgi:hypothetical protein